jgi:hypothetical protein
VPQSQLPEGKSAPSRDDKCNNVRRDAPFQLIPDWRSAALPLVCTMSAAIIPRRELFPENEKSLPDLARQSRLRASSSSVRPSLSLAIILRAVGRILARSRPSAIRAQALITINPK